VISDSDDAGDNVGDEDTALLTYDSVALGDSV
jgi:hypothetical protein